MIGTNVISHFIQKTYKCRKIFVSKLILSKMANIRIDQKLLAHVLGYFVVRLLSAASMRVGGAYAISQRENAMVYTFRVPRSRPIET